MIWLRKKNFKENRDLEGQKDFSNFEEFNMSKKKDTELEIIDTADGAVIKSGKKTIAALGYTPRLLYDDKKYFNKLSY